MSAVYGALLLSASVLLFQWAYIHHRRPVPSRWTGSDLLSQLVCISITAAIAAGLGFIVRFLFTLESIGFTVTEAVLLLVVVAVAAGAVIAMSRQWARLQQEVPASGAAVHDLRVFANDPGPGMPPRKGSSRDRVA